MRTALKINFSASGYSLAGTVVSGFQTSMDAFLVCLGTREVTDTLFPSKGTSLRRQATSGALFSEQKAATAAAIAGAKISYFLIENDETAYLQQAVATADLAVALSSGRLDIVADLTAVSGEKTDLSALI